jgi:hypothetical protein
MKWLIPAIVAFAQVAHCAAETSMRLPAFPAPGLVQNEFGGTKTIGFLTFLRELHKGGVHGLDETEFMNSNYAVLRSDSLPSLAAWLEAACGSVGVELQQARKSQYDGAVSARLLEVGAELALLRGHGKPLAMPLGVLICRRVKAWGDLPGDGARDAYVLAATERGLLVYDPPTRQVAPLSEFPNAGDVVTIQF